MKKIFKNLLFAAILTATSTIVHAQWMTTGNTGAAGYKLGMNNAIDLRIVTNGATRVTVKKNTGFVGIGTTAPGTKLEVAGGDARINLITVGLGGGSLSDNTALGYVALASNTSGVSNTAVGYRSLTQNTAGYYNTATGYNALFANTTGYDNVANGFVALAGNTTGDLNTASGAWALVSNTTGFQNSANGYSALFINNTGSYNTANGSGALYQNTTGNNNTANGASALINSVTGFCNTADGTSALFTNTTGSNNTAVGCGADVSVSNLNNATAIGAGAIVTASDAIMLGNTSVTSVKAAGSYIIYSDGRFKKNIKENVPGLEFINELKPVTYNYDINKLNDYINPVKNESSKKIQQPVACKAQEDAIAKKEKIVYTGFIAQEVERLPIKRVTISAVFINRKMIKTLMV